MSDVNGNTTEQREDVRAPLTAEQLEVIKGRLQQMADWMNDKETGMRFQFILFEGLMTAMSRLRGAGNPMLAQQGDEDVDCGDPDCPVHGMQATAKRDAAKPKIWH